MITTFFQQPFDAKQSMEYMTDLNHIYLFDTQELTVGSQPSLLARNSNTADSTPAWDDSGLLWTQILSDKTNIAMENHDKG